LAKISKTTKILFFCLLVSGVRHYT
jgi:hypothetical protein